MLAFTAVALLLVIFLLVRMPVAFAMGIAGTLGLALHLGIAPALSVLERTFYESSSSFILVAIPLFILMAELLTAGDVTRRAIYACQAWIGHVRGGLAMAAVGAAVILAALIGSSTASAAAMASAAYPEMRRHGYSEQLAAAVVSVGGTLAVVVPPSIVLVVYGVMTETSIGRLFIAGIVPGLITALGLMLVVAFYANRTDQAPAGEPFVFSRAAKLSWHIWPMALLIVVVIGAIYTGLVTPTEAAALGVFGSALLGLAQRSLSFRSTTRAFSSAISATVMIMIIIICSGIFGNYLAFSHITQGILEAVTGSGLSRHAILIMIVVTLLLLGMVMDQLAILSIAIPLAFPTIVALHFDPVWFGVIVTKTVEIGLLTPPLGINAYVTAGQTGAPLKTVFRGLLPFILMELMILILLISFPELTIALPNAMMN